MTLFKHPKRRLTGTVDQWLTQYVENVVAATNKPPSKPPPPLDGWDRIMSVAPLTVASARGSRGDEPPPAGLSAQDARPRVATSAAPVRTFDGEIVGRSEDSLRTGDATKSESAAESSRTELYDPAVSMRNVESEGASRDTRKHQSVSSEALRRRLTHLQAQRELHSNAYVSCNLDLGKLAEGQHTPTKALSELKRKADSAQEEMAFYDAWIAEMSEGAGEELQTQTAKSMSGSGEVSSTNRQHGYETPRKSGRARQEGTQVHTLGLFEDEDAALEEMDCVQ